MIATVIFFIIIIGLLITSHEFGHYLIGTMCGARVNEFTVGFGPKLFSFYKGETLFAVRLLPLGGACIFDGADAVMGEEADLDEHSLPNLPPLKRAATLIAGPFFNFLLSFLLGMILVGFTGVDLPVLNTIMEGSAAEEAGLMPGDVIRRIDGEHVHLYREVSMISAMYSGGESMDIEYVRDGERHTVTVLPKYSEEDGRYYIGFTGGVEVKCNPLQIFRYAFYEVQYWVRYTIRSLGMLFTGKIGIDSLSGPVGMATMVNETYEEVKPYGITSIIFTMMNLLLLLSINVGIINLLPLPAFDGGKLIFALIELVSGHRVPPEKEAIVHLAGTVGILVLMVVVMYHDIARLF